MTPPVCLAAALSLCLVLPAASQETSRPVRAGIERRGETVQIRKAIDAYFRLRYEALRAMAQQDFEDVVVRSEEGRALVTREQTRHALQIENARINDLQLLSYELDLTIDSIDIYAERAHVVLTESSRTRVAADPDGVQTTSGIRHEVDLVTVDGEWRIASDDYTDDLTREIEGAAGDVDALIAAIHNEQQQLEVERVNALQIRGVSDQATAAAIDTLERGGYTKEEIEQLLLRSTREKLNRDLQVESDGTLGNPTTMAGTFRSYNRTKAVNYAHKWAYGRNSNFADFAYSRGLGGDCTNFVSQVLNAGGAPEDRTGSYVWYYDSMSKRSPSWSGVVEIYNYLTANTYTGPVGRDTSMYAMLPGDMVQLKFLNERFSHSVVVVSTEWVWSWKKFAWLFQIKVASHESNHDDYLLDNFGAVPKRYVTITGYYD